MKTRRQETFIVQIKARENNTLQGIVERTRDQRIMPFHNAAELLNLMNSGVQEDAETAE